MIVDEASMLSSSLMYHLLTALAEDAEIILAGDPDQLASVDAGRCWETSLLSDLVVQSTSPHKRIEELKIIHRIKDAPSVLALAASIRRKDVAQTFNVLQSDILMFSGLSQPMDKQWMNL